MLLGSACVKATHKMLVKLTPGSHFGSHLENWEIQMSTQPIKWEATHVDFLQCSSSCSAIFSLACPMESDDGSYPTIVGVFQNDSDIRYWKIFTTELNDFDDAEFFFLTSKIFGTLFLSLPVLSLVCLPTKQKITERVNQSWV